MDKEHYWLKADWGSWTEVTQAQFVAAERAAGFRPKPGLGPVATGGFSSGSIHGAIRYGTQEPPK